MKKFRRAMHFDFHTMPNIDGLFSNFNADEFAKKLKENHVEYINFTARCNIGFSYYNTKVGKKYPGLERDVLKETLDACHKQGIGVTAYINAGLNHEYMADHQDACRMNKNGVIYGQDKTDNFFRVNCYNSSYGQHLLDEIREIASYDVDGIFCDCIKDFECYCPKCVEKMKEQGVDFNDKAQVLKFQAKVREDLIVKIKEVVEKTAKKPIKLYLNCAPWREGVHTHNELECLTNSQHWGYDYFYAVAPYGRTRFEDRVYMSARFQNCWGDFGGIKTLASMQNDLYDAMMNCYALSFGDHLHPIDGLEDEVIERIGKVFEEKMLYEQFDENAEYVCETAVLAERDSMKADPYLQGVCRMLSELKIPYNIYNEFYEWKNIKVMVITRAIELTENLKTKLLDFKKKGGKLVFLGSAIDTGKQLGLLDYIELLGEDTNDNAYLTYGEKGMRWAVYKPSRLIKNISGKEVCKYVSNVFNMDYDGRHCYFYRPQGEITDKSAVVIGDNGTACVCFDMSLAYKECYLKEHKDIFGQILDEFNPNHFIKASGMPATARIAVTENEKNVIVHVKSTFAEVRLGRGIIEDHVYMKNSTVSIKGEYVVRTLPDLSVVESTVIDGRTVFESGNVEGYKAFSLVKNNS